MRKHYLSTVADELASRNWPLNCRAVYECSRDFKVCNSRGSYGGQVGRGGEGRGAILVGVTGATRRARTRMTRVIIKQDHGVDDAK